MRTRHTCTHSHMHTCIVLTRYCNVPSLQEERSQGEIATAAMASINQFLSKQAGQPPSNRQMAGQPLAQPPHPMGQGMGQQDLSANPYFQVRCVWVLVGCLFLHASHDISNN